MLAHFFNPSLHVKPYFLFPNVLKRWSFQKNCAGIWSFLYYQEGWYFFFQKIWSNSLDGKWKMIFFKNMTFSSNALKRLFFQKIALEYDFSCIIWESRIWWYDIFSLYGKWKMIFLKKHMEIWHFLYICINVTNMILPYYQKKSKTIFSQENTLKGDWHSRSHSRKSSNNFLYFYGDLHWRFHVLLSSEKKQET